MRTKLFGRRDPRNVYSTKRRIIQWVMVLSMFGSLLCFVLISCCTSTKKSSGTKMEDPKLPWSERVKTILLWTPFYRIKTWWIEGMSGFEGCPVTNCAVITDRRFLKQSSAVMFHTMDLYKPGIADMPRSKPQGQTWVFRSMESPVHIYLGQENSTDLRPLDGIFDLTMTYKSNSDIPDEYGFIRENVANYDDLPKNHMELKSEFALWYVTNCNLSVHSGVRFKIVKSLQKYFPIDIYGPCGKPDPCQKFRETPTKWWRCTTEMKRKYKFYIAFENSRCSDYITEKFWWALQQGVVPVVIGPDIENYRQVAPPHSFIHADEFKTMRDLAEYLISLSKSRTAYLEYFKWRKKYEIQIGPRTPPWCQLCDMLNNAKLKTRNKPTYKISEYFGRQNNCYKDYKSTGLTDSNILLK